MHVIVLRFVHQQHHYGYGSHVCFQLFCQCKWVGRLCTMDYATRSHGQCMLYVCERCLYMRQNSFTMHRYVRSKDNGVCWCGGTTTLTDYYCCLCHHMYTHSISQWHRTTTNQTRVCERERENSVWKRLWECWMHENTRARSSAKQFLLLWCFCVCVVHRRVVCLLKFAYAKSEFLFELQFLFHNVWMSPVSCCHLHLKWIESLYQNTKSNRKTEEKIFVQFHQLAQKSPKMMFRCISLVLSIPVPSLIDSQDIRLQRSIFGFQWSLRCACPNALWFSFWFGLLMNGTLHNQTKAMVSSSTSSPPLWPHENPLFIRVCVLCQMNK